MLLHSLQELWSSLQRTWTMYTTPGLMLYRLKWVCVPDTYSYSKTNTKNVHLVPRFFFYYMWVKQVLHIRLFCLNWCINDSTLIHCILTAKHIRRNVCILLYGVSVQYGIGSKQLKLVLTVLEAVFFIALNWLVTEQLDLK